MLTVDALKNLFIALGGDAEAVADINLNAEAVNALAELAESGGIGSYDVIIKLNDVSLGEATAGELIKGTYAELNEKFLAGELISGAVYGVKEEGTNIYNRHFNTLAVECDDYVSPGNDNNIKIFVSNIYTASSSYVSETSGGTNNVGKKILSAGINNGLHLSRCITIKSDNSIVLQQ